MFSSTVKLFVRLDFQKFGSNGGGLRAGSNSLYGDSRAHSKAIKPPRLYLRDGKIVLSSILASSGFPDLFGLRLWVVIFLCLVARSLALT